MFSSNEEVNGASLNIKGIIYGFENKKGNKEEISNNGEEK